MQITEKDLEDLIFEDLRCGSSYLVHRGLTSFLIGGTPNKTYWNRQVYLKDYGIADIIGYTRYRGKIYVDVIELKNVPLKPDDFNQLFRYCHAVKVVSRNSFRHASEVKINPILIGPSIDSGHYIHNASNASVYTFDYGLYGFNFERRSNGWHIPESNDINIKNLKRYDEVIVHPSNY